MVFPGILAAPSSGCILEKHASLPPGGRRGFFQPPKCSILTPTLFLEMRLLEDHLYIFALGLVFMKVYPPYRSHPDFLHHLPILCLNWEQQQGHPSFFSCCWLCLHLLPTMICYLRARVTSSTTCVLGKHLVKYSDHMAWVQIPGSQSTRV